MTVGRIPTIDLEAQRRRRRLRKFEPELGEVPEEIPELERPIDIEAQRRRRELPEVELELGEVPEVIPEFELPEVTVEDLIGRIYEDLQPLTLQFVEEWATTDPEAFLEDMVKFRGRTPDTELMLELFGATPELIEEIFVSVPPPEPLKIPEGGYKFTQEVEGIERLFTIDKDYLVKVEDTIVGKYNPETGMLESWGIQQTVVPVDGIRKLVTITPDNRAYDENNKFLGTYNTVTLEIDKVSTVDKASEVWDALIFGSRQMWELGENFFLSALPNLVFQDTPAHQRAVYGDEFSDRVDEISLSIRDKFRSAYAGNKAEFEDWVEKNPNLQPRLDYAEGVTEHPNLLTDPFYWMYEFANIAPFCVAVVASSITTGALTGGNPLAMIAGGAAVVYPVETQAVMEALLANGANEQQAAKIAGPAGIIIASLESLGRLPLLKAISPQLMRIFKREASAELGKLTARELFKKGIKTALATELSEVITEVLQEATQNAAVKVINENQSLFEGLDIIAAKTAVATAPLALFGGGVSMRRVAPSETQGFTDIELEAKGFVKEPKSDAWYQPIKVTEEKITPIEPKPEVVTPEQYVSKRTEGMTLDEIGKLRSDLAVKKETQITLERQYGEGFVDKVIHQLDLKIAELRGEPLPKAVPAKPPVEIAPPEVEARRAEEEIAGLKETLAEDPVAQVRFTIGGKKVDLTNFISLKEQTFPEYFTVKQAQAIRPRGDFTRWTEEGTREFNRVPRDVVLDDLTKRFNMTPDEIAGRVMRIREERRRIRALEQQARLIEVPVEKIEVAPAIPLVTQMKAIFDDIQITVAATEASIRGLRGDEAALARETLSGLQRELAHIERTMESFEKRPDMPEATKLRSTIMAMASFKGLSKGQLQDIFSSVAGRRQLRVIKQEHLLDILEKVRVARPVRIRGEKVVTPKTEAKIQSLKESLISSRQMTNEIYNHLMERLNLNTDRYEHAAKFITETEAKDLIRSMNDEVVLAEWDIKVQDAMAKNPDIKEVRDRLNVRGMTGTGVAFDGKPIKISRGKELHSMRYYMLNLQKKLNAPVYDAWQKINLAHLVARDRHNQQLRKLQETTPNFGEIAADEAALKRIEDYIASKNNLAKIKAPELTDDEMAIATELQKGYFEAQNDVRFIRFTNAYAENEGDIDLIAKEIPSAPRAALRRAIDIYEGRGADELRKFTDTQKWGVRGADYDPASYIKPSLYYRPPRETTFAKGLLRTRESTEYEADDRNIIQRYARHQKQLIALEEMSSLVRAFGRLYSEHAGKMVPSTQRDVSKVISRGINELKGYREDGGAIVHLIERIYGQVASAVFWRPDLVARNKFQNFAFNPDFWAGRFIDPRNKALTEERRRWFEVFVSQERVFQYDFLLYGEKPLPGFGRVTRLARRTSLYPWSDKTNRAEAFYVRINRVDRALDAYEKDGNVQKLIDDSGLNEFEPRQQAEALELLAMESVDYGIDGMDAVTGREAFALYNTQQLVNNVHFLYDRSQRAPAEMGATGKTLGNILVFNRSWGERFLLQANKLSPESKADIKEKLRAVQVIVGVIVAGLLAGEAYKEVTGKEHSPYNPLNIITWAPGGLALGVTEDISNVIYLMTQAIEGDESAFAALPGVIANVSTLTLPFYKNFIQAVDAITDMKGVDVWAMRKIREMIDEEYEVRGGVHEVERTLLEKLQRAIFSLKDDPVTPQEKIEESESLLGMDIDVGDLAFTLEEPDIHDMRKLNTDLSRILANIKPEEITKENGYSELAVAWEEKERYEAIWNTMPHKKIYEITELPEELAKWANRNKRKLALVAQYQKLEGSEAKAFLDAHAELKENPSIEWLKRFPIANAHLALWGQTKIYSMEAYDEFNRLIKELDIPDDAIPELTLPPKGSVENYFKYQDMLTEFAPNSWEVQYLMTQDDELRQFLQRNPIETPVRSLELKILHRPQFEAYDLLETDEERAAFKAANPEWVDNMRRMEAIENAASDEIVESWVKRGNIIDEFGAGSSEAMVWFLDNPEVHEWARGVWPDKYDPTDWNEPVLRINAKWRETDEKYDSIAGDDTEARRLFLAANEEYRKDRRRREALGDGFSEAMVEKFVEYWELPVKGFRQERFLLDNPDFASTMHTIKGIILPKADEVPSVKFDEIYEKHSDKFDKLWGLDNNKSPYYEENEVKRAEARNDLRYDAKGNITEFGKAEIRLEAYNNLVPDEHVETYVDYYSLPAKGFRQERILAENKDFYKKVWLGILKNDRMDFRNIPAKQYDDLYDKHKDLFDKWDDYKDPDSPLYIDNADDRREARQVLLDANPAFAEARIRRDAYQQLIGHEEFVEDFVAYRLLPEKGYEDERFLQEHKGFYDLMFKLKYWTDRIDFDRVPSPEVERLYEIYQEIDGTQEKLNYRVQHRDLDEWGQKVHGWKPAIAQVNLEFASKEDIINAITRLSDMDEDERARIEGMSKEDILDALSQTFKGKIQAFLNRGSLTKAEKEAVDRMVERKEGKAEMDKLLKELEEKLRRLTK